MGAHRQPDGLACCLFAYEEVASQFCLSNESRNGYFYPFRIVGIRDCPGDGELSVDQSGTVQSGRSPEIRVVSKREDPDFSKS